MKGQNLPMPSDPRILRVEQQPTRAVGRGRQFAAVAILACEQCGAEFSAKPAQIARKRFCSKKCYDDFRRLSPPSAICEACGSVFQKSRGVKGGYYHKQRFCGIKCARASLRGSRGGYLDKHGYRIVTVDGAQVAQHRYVMEAQIGRKLFAHETVHHRNGDRADNRPENLELWSSRHGKGQAVSDKIAFCKSFLSEYGISHEVLDLSNAIAGVAGLL